MKDSQSEAATFFVVCLLTGLGFGLWHNSFGAGLFISCVTAILLSSGIVKTNKRNSQNDN